MADELNGNFKQNANSDYLPYIDQYNEPFNEETFRQMYKYEPIRESTFAEKLKDQLLCDTNTFFKRFPIFEWLPKYKIKEDLTSDIIAGATVAVMHIPQGMAYALLGGVSPIVGIYMAFFPIWIYIVMGTSRHVSMGTFAVICIMVSKSVVMYSDVEGSSPTTYNVTALGPNFTVIEEIKYSPIEVATALCFVVGIWQVIFGVFRLGSLSVVLSDTLVSGFTTGASIHVFTSQITNLVGVRVKRYTGPFKLIYTYIDLFKQLGDSNTIAIYISICCITILVFFNEVVKPFLRRKYPKCNVPIPIELVIIVAGTLISSYLGLEAEHGIRVVGDVPTGIPIPQPPPLGLLPNLIVDGLVVSVVAISINLSMAQIFARKMNYDIDCNQEILASGVSNVFGSFFSCMPISVSLSRSLIQHAVGGKTQIASVVSCCLLLFVLLFIGPFFEPLPNCVLSSIIIVALKGMLMQVTDCVSNFRTSKLDGLVWLVSFLAVVCLDIDYGLVVGIVLSVVVMVIRGQNPEVLVLGQVQNTNIYLDIDRFKTAQPIPSILLLKIIGGLHFANCEKVRKEILDKYFSFQNKTAIIITNTEKLDTSSYVLFSMSSVSYLDPSAVKCFIAMQKDFKKDNCQLLLCDCTTTVYDTLDKCGFFVDFSTCHVFPSILDSMYFIGNDKKPD